ADLLERERPDEVRFVDFLRAGALRAVLFLRVVDVFRAGAFLRVAVRLRVVEALRPPEAFRFEDFFLELPLVPPRADCLLTVAQARRFASRLRTPRRW